jgi:hypothetical protein
MLRSSYTVRLPEFEGPLELLLFFVQQEELPIAELSIARLVEDFLEYVRLMESLDLELAGEFFVVAAQLMLLKLRFLLRRPSTGGRSWNPPSPTMHSCSWSACSGTDASAMQRRSWHCGHGRSRCASTAARSCCGAR